MRNNRVRIINPRIKKAEPKEPKNTFGQNILLIFVGAIISFLGTVGTTFLTSQYEVGKLSTEQKMQFERELVSNISTNLSAVENITFRWRQDTAQKDTLGESRIKEAFMNDSQPMAFRVESTQLMMNAYVSDDLCWRYHQLNDSLVMAGQLALKNLSKRGEAYADGWLKAANAYERVHYGFTRFIREFHTAILQ